MPWGNALAPFDCLSNHPTRLPSLAAKRLSRHVNQPYKLSHNPTRNFTCDANPGSGSFPKHSRNVVGAGRRDQQARRPNARGTFRSATATVITQLDCIGSSRCSPCLSLSPSSPMGRRRSLTASALPPHPHRSTLTGGAATSPAQQP